MYDQAKDLRRLVRHCTPEDMPGPGPRPALVVVTSGKGGVGTTTIAVNLAVAVARAGLRTVLVDCDPSGGDAAVLCGLEERYTLADVLAGQRTVCEVLQPGPGAVQVVPGMWAVERFSDYPATAGKHLLDQLRGLGNKAEVIMLDAGNSVHPMSGRLWQAADLIFAVTTPETPSILDTYASIKMLGRREKAAPIYSLVNRAADAQIAENVHGRLERACHRFLAIRLHRGGHLSLDPMVAAAGQAADAFVAAVPGCDASRQLTRLAKALAATVAAAKRQRPLTENRELAQIPMTA